MTTHASLLQTVKERTWFYEFDLPDGSKTSIDIPPAVARVHETRREKLREVISRFIPDPAHSTALDFASHEGYFSVELSRHFASVRGLEIRNESIESARLVTQLLGRDNVTYECADLQRLGFEERLVADFVLVYGLLYHVENPIHVVRLASQLSRKHVLVETQVFPFDISGRIEDGHYEWQRGVEGVFSVSVDYSVRREGGSTDIALIPSLNALVFLLKYFGFASVEVLQFGADDYEQFRRGSRAIVYGQKHGE